MKFEEFEELEVKKSLLATIKGGTSSTTLMTEVGRAENEYEDTNGNCEFDEGEDKFIGTFDIC